MNSLILGIPKRRFISNRLNRPALILLIAAVAPLTVAQEADGPPPIEVRRLSPTLHQLTCNGTVGVIASTGEDGILLVDTGYAGTAEALQNELAALGSGPVRFIVNTHGDADHVGGNAALGGNAVIIAGPQVGVRMSTFFVLPAVETAGLPNLTLRGPATLQFNGEAIRILSMAGGHTDGDVIVHFTKSHVACIGDLSLLGTFPNADPGRGGDALRLIEVLTEIQTTLPPDTTLVAAHGGPFTMEDLSSYIEMIEETVAAVAAEVEAGRNFSEIVERNPLSPWAEWESPDNGLGFEDWIGEIHASLVGSGPQSINAPVTEKLEHEGAEAAAAHYRMLKATEPEEWRFSEAELNMLGYQLLARNRIEDAVTIFELNVEAFPEAFNTYDSLGEAYMTAGRTADAIANYQRSLDLNPNNTNAAAMLSRLRQE